MRDIWCIQLIVISDYSPFGIRFLYHILLSFFIFIFWMSFTEKQDYCNYSFICLISKSVIFVFHIYLVLQICLIWLSSSHIKVKDRFFMFCYIDVSSVHFELGNIFIFICSLIQLYTIKSPCYWYIRNLLRYYYVV